MLRSQKTHSQYDDDIDDDEDDDDDERHSSIELKDILNRKLTTSHTHTLSDSDQDETEDETDTDTAADNTDTNTDTAETDNNPHHIGHLTPQYTKTHARHRTTLPRKTTALALFLTAVGITFLTMGLSFLLTGSGSEGDGGSGGSLSDSVPFIVLGGLAFIPGSFHVVILYLAYTRQYGWTYDHIPTYDRQ